MKKALLVSAIMLCVASAQAQTADNLDTVFGRYPFYFYNYYDNCWDHDTVHDNMICYTGVVESVSTASQLPCNPLAINDTIRPSYGGCYLWYPKFHTEIAVGFVPDPVLRVIGFAYARIEYGDAWDAGLSQWTSTWVEDSVICSDATCNFNVYDRNMQLLQSKTVTNRDIHPARVIPIGKQLCNVWIPRPTSFLPIYEVFFDQPIDLADTFYMSKTMMYNDSIIYTDVTEMYELHFEPENPRIPAFDSLCNHRLPPEIRRFRDNIINGEWEQPENEVWYMATIFPIVEYPGDTCPQAQGLQYVRSSADKAFFRWQRGTNHHDWQLSYGPAGTAPEDGTILNCANTSSSLVTLDPDSHYVAYVRARCKFARYEYGPWSAPLAFSLNGGNSIEDVGNPDITLTPNPASEQVTVAATGMQSIELLGVDGTVIMRREGLMQDEYTLDLKGLAAGVYMVRVSTAKGTATRRLAVAR